MSAVLAPAARLRPNRFMWLMGLYAENYLRIERVLQLRQRVPGCYVSSIADGLDLSVELLARHAYTDEVRLTYGLIDPLTGQRDPSAYIRVYHDARLAEATHCYIGRRWQDTIGLHPEPKLLMNHRLRMNAFLDKWLEYLGEQGHSPFTLLPCDAAMPPLCEKLAGGA